MMYVYCSDLCAMLSCDACRDMSSVSLMTLTIPTLCLQQMNAQWQELLEDTLDRDPRLDVPKHRNRQNWASLVEVLRKQAFAPKYVHNESIVECV